MLDGHVTEIGITKYSIFLTDREGVRLPGMDAVLNVTAVNITVANAKQCCEAALYSGIRIAAVLPTNYTGVRVEVVPVSEGVNGSVVMPAGLITDVVLDWYDPAFLRSSRARHSFGCSCPLLFVAAASAMALAFSHAAADDGCS